MRAGGSAGACTICHASTAVMSVLGSAVCCLSAARCLPMAGAVATQPMRSAGAGRSRARLARRYGESWLAGSWPGCPPDRPRGLEVLVAEEPRGLGLPGAARRPRLVGPVRACLAWARVSGDPCTVPSAFILLPQGSRRMAEAPQRPPDPLAPLPHRAEVVQPDPPRSRLPRVGVVLAAGRSQRLASVTGGGSKALLRLGG